MPTALTVNGSQQRPSDPAVQRPMKALAGVQEGLGLGLRVKGLR
jgi:hypothetical protein